MELPGELARAERNMLGKKADSCQQSLGLPSPWKKRNIYASRSTQRPLCSNLALL
jgi:hypothetical protein